MHRGRLRGPRLGRHRTTRLEIVQIEETVVGGLKPADIQAGIERIKEGHAVERRVRVEVLG